MTEEQIKSFKNVIEIQNTKEELEIEDPLEEEEELEEQIDENGNKIEKKTLNFHWYIVSTPPKKEGLTMQYLANRINNSTLKRFFKKIFTTATIHKEEVKNSKGELKINQKIFTLYPGYIFVNMKMDDRTWYLVRNTDGVKGFVGSTGNKTKPLPVPDDDISNICKKLGIESEEADNETFQVGDNVAILSGIFQNQEDVIVTAVDNENKKAKVTFYFFGKPNEAEFNFSDIVKIKK